MRQEAEYLLVLDTGDALVGGGLLGDKTQGEAIVAGMNLMGYDAMALGPQELSLEYKVLQRRMDESDFPMLSANVVLAGTENLVADPYTILEVGTCRVGVIGLTRVPKQMPPEFEVLDPRDAAARYVPLVSSEADVIVVLTNQRYRSALALAAAVPGIDLMIAALPNQLPSQVAHVPQTGTMVVTAEQPLTRHTGRNVGELVVSVAADGALTEESWIIRPLVKQLPDDLTMRLVLEKYKN